MANLRYSDKHNMVAFLKKPTESVGFTKIVNFLKCTTLRTLANGIQELVASIDNKKYTITEASIRSKLQLADATCISNLHGLATLGGYAGDHIPLLPAMLAGVTKDQGEGSANPAEPHPTPGPTITPIADEATTIGVGVETEGATTTTSGLDAGLDSGNIHESSLRSHEAPFPEGNTSGSAKDKELMEIVPKLESKIDSLEKELKETKQTLRNVVLTLVKKVKSLEVALKRKKKNVVLSDSEDEEIENQGRNIQDIDDDPLVSLVRDYMEEKEADFVTPTKVSASGEAQEEEISLTILEAAKTLSQVASQTVSTYKRRARSAIKGKDISTGLDAEVKVNPGSADINIGSTDLNTGSTPVSTPSIVQKVNVIVPSPVKGQREGKAPMPTEDVQATKRTKAHIQQEEVGLAEAIRLQALQDEEAARQVHLDALLAKRISEEQELSEQQKKRKAKVQEAAQYYTEEDWDTIRAKLEANAELIKSLQGENVSSDDFAKRMLKKLTFEELKDEFEKLMKSIEGFVPMGTEERVKRPGEEEIEKPVKKRGKIKKQMERKGTHADKTAQYKAKEDMEALVKGNDTDSSSRTDILVSAVPVAIKPPSIVNWKIIKLGKKGVYQIIREDGTYITYINFGAMLKSISRDDLTELYRIVMQRYGTNGPEDEYERVLWGDLKTMFDPPLTDINMLTERRYHILADVCHAMLDKKLQGNKKDEACYQLLKLIEKQTKNKLL
ncbi:hypothetical protein Tco_0970340 [Tanacetum coccineum]